MGVWEIHSTAGSSAHQPQLITPPVMVPALVPSVVAVAPPSAVALSGSLQSAAPSRPYKRSRSHRLPRPWSALAQLSVTALSTWSSWSWPRHLSGTRTCLPAFPVTRLVPGPLLPPVPGRWTSLPPAPAHGPRLSPAVGRGPRHLPARRLCGH